MNFISRCLAIFIFCALFAVNSFSQKVATSYQNAFKNIDSLAISDKPKEAVSIIDSLNISARTEGNTAMLVKSVVYRMLFQSYLTENGFKKNIDDLRNDIALAKQPAKSILQSLLAECYWKYYEQNKYEFYNRTTVAGAIGDDVQTWSLPKLAEETIKNYQYSLAEDKFLQNTKLDGLEDILTGDVRNRYLRPTLYDVLAHRALDTYANTQFDFFMNDNAVDFNTVNWFVDFNSFLKITIPSDSASFNVKALLVFKKLISFHLNDPNKAALADIELKRLKFIYQKSSSEDKQLKFYSALGNLYQFAKPLEVAADILFEQASLCDNNQRTFATSLTLIKGVELANSVVIDYPKSTGAINSKNLLRKIKTPEVKLQIQAANLPLQPIQVLFTYKNVDTIFLKFYKISSNTENHDFYNEPDYNAFIKSNKLFRESFVLLPKNKDYNTHTLLDKIDALPLGRYILFVQNVKNSQSLQNGIGSYGYFSVTNMAVSSRLTRSSFYEYFVVNSKTSEPIKGAKIEENVRSYKDGKYQLVSTKASLTSNSGRVESTNVGRIADALVTKGEDSLKMELTSYYYSEGAAKNKIILFTDRPIYRPGQTVFFKGIYLETKDYKTKVLPGEETSVSIRDANQKEIQAIAVSTNSYGTFQGSFVIPVGKLNGQMTINTTYGQTTFQVEEYKRPTFELVFDKLNQKYKLNDSIKIVGKAVSFSGYPVAGAKVKYKIVRSLLPNIDRPYSTTPPKQIAFGNAITQANGVFTFNFIAEAEKITSDNFRYQISVDVTDISGETKTNVQTVNVGKKDLLFNVYVPQQMFLSGTTDSILLNITNLNNQPIKGKIQAEWYKLEGSGKILTKNPFGILPEEYALSKEEFLKYFPNQEYKGNDELSNWPSKRINFNQNLSTEDGFSQIEINEKLLETGFYKVNLKAINEQNDTVTVSRTMRIFDKAPTVIQRSSEWLVAEKTFIKKNESAIFRVASPKPNTQLYYEVYYKDSVVTRSWVKASPKQTIISIKPQSNFEDGFAVQFNMVENGVSYQSLIQVSLDEKDKQLDISFLTFRDKLQPGEKETWKLSIRNKLGEKQTAEMVATLYDASLDNLKPMDWKYLNNRTHYNYYNYNWKLPLMGVIQSNDLWFLKNYNTYFSALPRNYEQINLFGYNYYGGFNNAYQTFLMQKELENRNNSLAASIKKLNAMKDGKLFYGVVKDKDGYGLPHVIIKSGKQSTSTDSYGLYSIDVKSGDKVKFSAIGFHAREIIIGTQKRNDVILIEDENSLNEVAVVGYGTQKRTTLTGAVSGLSVGEGPASKNEFKKGTQIALKGRSSVGYDKKGMPTTEPLKEGVIAVDDNKVYDFLSISKYDELTNTYIIDGKVVKGAPKVVTRSNFTETAFFYPQLQTNEEGELTIDFTIPQSLTRYKMMGFAHTKDFKTGYVTKDLITQKQLAISANAPRFFREGDTILFTAKLNNLSGSKLKGDAFLELRNALTGKVILIFGTETLPTRSFELDNNGSSSLSWKLFIPADIGAITYRIIAQSGMYSDGEKMTIPVLPNRTLITEGMPINVRAGENKTFTMSRLLTSGVSKTLKNQSLTFEFTANPVWYAVQALPYLMEYPNECAEQTFSRFYANSIATGIINSSPKIKETFQTWTQANNGSSLLSNLEKNAELKSILLEETPWLRNADSETERKKRLAMLFDLNRMAAELSSNFEKLETMQNSDGAFSWFPGMPDDQYITQHIVLGIGKLKYLKLIDEKAFSGVNKMLNKAMIYLDGKLEQDYLSEKTQHIGYLPLHYLYTRSYGNQKNNSAKFNKALTFYLKKIVDEWKILSPYQQAQAALVLYRNGNNVEAQKIIRLLKQRSQQNEEMGMYWAENRAGWWWYENPIETQALLIEAFDEVAKDSISVEEMKIWLLKNKQSNDWRTTKATAAACYVLLMHGYNLLAETTEPEILIAGKKIAELGVSEKPKEAGIGYQKIVFGADKIKPEMARVQIKNPNKTVTWGAMYWQYFEELDKIIAAETGIKIKKQLFLQTRTAKGAILASLNGTSILKPGDLLTVRIEIKADRAMEYLHLKDMRSSGLEPVNVISRYKYQDGLGYYESTKDVATNFFISYMPKGVYVFEYPLRVMHTGSFSNGVTSLQSMYAPEFSAHTGSTRITVGQ